MTQFDQRYQQVDTQYNADYITIQQQPLSLTEKQRKQNRTRMLQRVKAIWIDGVLEPSLQGAAQVALQLQNKPSAIVSPLWHVMREFDTTGQLSSENASIVQVYDHASGEVLILGEPGLGKTTLLLELTRTLLGRAGQDEAHPIPVVFPLSSWATKRQPLTTWLASELHSRYQVPFPLAASWIETDQVLPLLDGLDEVAAPHREACVEAINAYRQVHGLIPTVICSRQTGYFALTPRLLLRTAVVVQPLTAEQIESYLSSGGERLDALRETLRKDADLRALASTPLMLNVLTVAYQGTPHEEVAVTGSLETKHEEVFASYVQRMLTRRSMSARYTPKQAIHWLSYLAGQMKRQSQTIFYLEQMQCDWLSGNRVSRVYDWLAIRLSGMLIGVLVSLIIGLFVSGDIYFSSLITKALLGGLLGGLLSKGNTPQRPTVRGGKARRALQTRLLQWLLIGGFIGLGSGLSVWWGISPSSSDRLLFGLSFGLSIGICSILLQLLLGENSTTEVRSQTPLPARGKAWQRPASRREVRNGLLAGLLIGLSFGLTAGLSNDWRGWLDVGLREWLAFGLSAGFLSFLLIGKSTAIQLTDLLVWTWRSLGKSLISKSHASATVRFIALSGLSMGLSNAIGFGLLSDWLSMGLSMGLLFGLSMGLSYWLLLGLIQGVSSVTIEDQRRAVPNQGIRRSALNGLVLGLISAMIVGSLSALSIGLRDWLGNGLINGMGEELPGGLLAGLLIGLLTGLLAGLLNGGLAYLRHYVLRFLLWRTGSVPWHYAQFLDYAAEQILLRKVGGGYIFLHRLLLDYFANLENGSDSNVLAEGRLEIFPLDSVSSTSAESSEAD